MIGAEVIITILLGGGAMAFATERVVRQVRTARHRYRNVLAKKAAHVERVRKVAAESLALRRENRQLDLALGDVTRECERLEEEIRRLARPENRVFVLDEKRLPQDETWLVTLSAPPPGGEGRQPPTWQGERKFRVWAADEEAARAKVHRRYPAAEGYAVATITARVKAKGEAKRAAAG